MNIKPAPAEADTAQREMDELKGHVAAMTDELLQLRELVGKIVRYLPEALSAAPPIVH